MQNLFQSHLLLGKVKGSEAPVWYPKSELTKHMLMLGKTGGGKTNFLYWILSQLIFDTPIWIFDRKRDFRHLIRMFPGKLLVLDLLDDFKCNPLAVPPFVKPRRWLDFLTDIFCRVNDLLKGGRGVMRIILEDMFKEYEIYDGKKTYPSFIEFSKKLKNLVIPRGDRNTGPRDSLVRTIDSYLASGRGVYDCSIGFDLEKLMNKSVVFELSGMLEEQMNFWVNFLLLWIFAYRIGKNERGNELRNIVVFDEAKEIFSPFENDKIGHSPITRMVTMLREFGVGIIAADQSAHLNNAIIGNTQLKILTSLQSGFDIDKAKKALGLNDDQIDYIYRLQLGEAITRYYKIDEPFILQIPKFPLE